MQDSIYGMTLPFYQQILHKNVTILQLENSTFLWTSMHNITT